MPSEPAEAEAAEEEAEAEAKALPLPEVDPEAAAEWVRTHLGDLAGDAAPPSPRFRGGQSAADAALAGFDVTGYASRRNAVWPRAARGASGLSPYVRHGLLPLSRLWDAVADGPEPDVAKFRDELLWQEYARHLYARLGPATGEALRFRSAASARTDGPSPWPRAMACVERAVGELERDGWLVNQARMWLASHWTVRQGASWRAGEDHFFRHLLDGSRAANRLGWQWSVGAATGRPYGFSRWQVEERAPGLCDECTLRARCPIEEPPAPPEMEPIPEPPAGLKRIDPRVRGAGPRSRERHGIPEAVWLTAESLGDADPALAANPELPARFVFDAARLAGWRLSSKRLAFLVETLAELATRRPLVIQRGDPARLLAGVRLAATFTPVPGWARLAHVLAPVEVHPWPWLQPPHTGPIGSYSAWRRGLERSSRGGR